jgi:RNA polymerase sigma factor (sigma-70 family)
VVTAEVRQWITLSGEMDQDDSDEALMLRYQAGDAAAFDQLYARHRNGLYRFILRQCRARGEAEELFQDVWMNLIQARARYRVEARFRTYLFTLAHNKLVDYFRSHARSQALLHEADDGADGLSTIAGSRTEEPQVRAEAREQGAAILRVLETLPSPQREAFLLHEEGGLSVEEIAQATGITFEAAKSRLRYALTRLRSGLQEYA